LAIVVQAMKVSQAKRWIGACATPWAWVMIRLMSSPQRATRKSRSRCFSFAAARHSSACCSKAGCGRVWPATVPTSALITLTVVFNCWAMAHPSLVGYSVRNGAELQRLLEHYPVPEKSNIDAKGA
jgi:hypothetical protein